MDHLDAKSVSQDSLANGCANVTANTNLLSTIPAGQSKRQQILDGAICTFLKHGYEGTGMNQVAEAAGVTKQTIYSHFGDKEGLFTAIVEELTEFHGKEPPCEIKKDATPEEVLRMLGQRFIRRQKDPRYLALLRVMIGESERFPELARLFSRNVIARGMEAFKSYFKQHPECGIDDPDATARVFVGSLVNLIIQQELLYYKEIAPFEMEHLIDYLIKLILGK
jgi:AcrR family transcriptional regulator